MGEPMVVDRHLYMTADRKRVVEEGDPEAHWLWAAPGQTVLRSEAEALGVVARVTEAVPVKQAEVAANKARSMPSNKAR